MPVHAGSARTRKRCRNTCVTRGAGTRVSVQLEWGDGWGGLFLVRRKGETVPYEAMREVGGWRWSWRWRWCRREGKKGKKRKVGVETVCEKEESPAGLICTQYFRLIHWRSPSGAVANRTTFSSPEKVPSTGHRPARSPAMHARLCFFCPQKHWMSHMTMTGDGQRSDGSTSTSRSPAAYLDSRALVPG
jgi:hypothetical protein